MKSHFSGLLAAVTLLGIVPLVHADSSCAVLGLPPSPGYPGLEQCIATGTTPGDFTIPQFNPALGQLEDFGVYTPAVYLTFTISDISGTANVTYPGPTRQNWGVAVSYTLSNPSLGLVGAGGPYLSPPYTVPGPGDYDLPWDMYAAYSEIGPLSIYRPNAAPFIGTGDVTFNIGTSEDRDDTSATVNSVDVTGVQYTMEISYSFGAVPEPGYYAVLAIGLGALVTIGRRKRAH